MPGGAEAERRQRGFGEVYRDGQNLCSMQLISEEAHSSRLDDSAQGSGTLVLRDIRIAETQELPRNHMT